jgi:HK97 family phage major capsid protein
METQENRNRALRERRSETWGQVMALINDPVLCSEDEWGRPPYGEPRFEALLFKVKDLNERLQQIERTEGDTEFDVSYLALAQRFEPGFGVSFLGLEQRSRQIEQNKGDHMKGTEFRGKKYGAPALGPPPHDPLDGYSEPESRENKEHRLAFQTYLRVGASELRSDQRALLYERRDMGTGGQGAYPGSTGGFFVPTGFFNDVEDALKYYGPMLNGGEGMPFLLDTDTGQPLPYPAADDTLQVGEQILENQQVSTQDVNLQMIMFGAWKYSTKLVKISVELLSDSAFDIENFLAVEFGRRLGRIVNTKTTVGVGTIEPMGIVTSILAGGNVITAAGSYANDGVGLANTIGSDDLVSLEHAVDPVYRPRGRYMMNDAVLKALKKVKDKYGRPLLWQEGTREGSPATVNGYPYLINNDMDQLQTVASSPTVTKRSMIFGDLSKHVIRRVKQLSILRLTERFAEYGQVGFLGFGRYDSQNLDIGHRALAILQNVY